MTALDAQVQDYIFNECIKTFLTDKVVVLVSQTAHHIQEADTVVIMDHGKIKDCGPPNRHIIEELHELVSEDDDLEKEVVDELKKKAGETDDEKSEEDHLLETEQVTGRRKVYSEVKKKGKVDFQTYMKYLMFGGGIFMILFNVMLAGITQFSESYSDKLLTKW